jgi:hypothetical protein
MRGRAAADALVTLPGMLELLTAAALVPWAQPLRFRPLPGWRTGRSGTINSSYGPAPQIASPKESIAWMTRGVRFRDRPSADPPGATLSHLPPRGIVVSAVIFQSGIGAHRPIELRLNHATRYDCCDGTYVAGGEYALSGDGPRHAYSVIVRVYFGSRASPAMRKQAQRALDQLQLPAPR